MIKKSNHPISRIFWFLASLKLAIFVLVGLAISLTAGTFIESSFDTATAKYWVYHAFWFRSLMVLLGINILVVALSRYPWKKRHVPFLLAHAGILTLLFGSWLTDRYGLDGSMRISEGETSSSVEVEEPALFVSESSQVKSIPMPWLPPGVKFSPFSLASKGLDYDVKIDQFVSHAEGDYNFLPNPEKSSAPRPAVKLLVQGGPMRIKQEFWLWAGQQGWMAFQAGPAFFAMGEEVPLPEQGPRLRIIPQKDGSVAYKAYSSSGELAQGRFPAGKVGGPIQAKWKGGVQISVAQFVPDATLLTNYKPSRMQYGNMAPPSAIHLVAGNGGEGAETWLGLGERAVLRVNGRDIELAYFNRQIMLPFALKLDRFAIERYEGSMSPKSYESNVTLVDARLPADRQEKVLISMNEPLKHAGLTVYQASYEDAMPRPTVSIFSINKDPGRPWKYGGSLLIVFGSILLFAVKLRRARAAQKNAA